MTATGGTDARSGFGADAVGLTDMEVREGEEREDHCGT